MTTLELMHLLKIIDQLKQEGLPEESYKYIRQLEKDIKKLIQEKE